MNFLYVQLSQEILILVAQDGGRMILLTQQFKKSTPTHVVNNSVMH